MRIGIIGAGNMGATLAAQLTRLGHQVAIANSRGPQTLAGVAAQTGATPVPITDVTSKADVVIVAIPEKSIPGLPAGLLSALPEDTVVIDAGNYVPQLRDGHIDAIDAGLPESQWVQSQLRHPVVKAFNTIRPASLASLGKPAGAAGRTVIPVAGDDPAAKAVVLELADQLGFDGLDAGPLAESWRQQPGTPIYTTDLPLDAARQALADATPEQTASWRSRHPQHTKLNTAMHPSSRTGVRFVLANPSDPSRLNEFSDWYDTYSAALTVPGYLANDVHFENPDASGEKQQPALRDDLRHRLPRPRDRLARHRALTRLPHPPVQRPARQAGLPGPARLLRPRRLPAPAGPARPAHRHPRHPLQRRRRHRAPAPGGPDPADGLVLLRRTIPDHRRIPRARRMARDIRDRRPRPPPRLPASDQPHAARTADPAPTKPVVPPGWHPQNQWRVN